MGENIGWYSWLTPIDYPNQFLLAYQNIKWSWPERTNDHYYYMRFGIRMMEVLRRRQKIKSPCISVDKPFDLIILRKVWAIPGCRAPYQIQDASDTHFPECMNKEKIKEAFFDEASFESAKVNPPCEEMLQIADDYTEVDLTKHIHSYLGIARNWNSLGIIYPNRVKVIDQAKEISFHSLVGNCGGYIGLFLGCAILQLPRLFLKINRQLKEFWFKFSIQEEKMNHARVKSSIDI